VGDRQTHPREKLDVIDLMATIHSRTVARSRADQECSTERKRCNVPYKQRSQQDSPMKTAALLADPINVKLLRLMQADARAPLAKLARSVGMSAPAVKERVLRLEEGGVIERDQVELNPRALGYNVRAFIRVRPKAGRENQIMTLA
jgi:predicted transcriptional regulator